jgi:hypothetical protein
MSRPGHRRLAESELRKPKITAAGALKSATIGIRPSRPSDRFPKPSSCTIFSASLSLISKMVEAVNVGFIGWSDIAIFVVLAGYLAGTAIAARGGS